MSQTYKAPHVPDSEVTPEFVRDELLSCFESANREFMSLLHQPVTDAQLKQQVTQFVEGTFAKCGASFDQPTKNGIVSAISECKANAEAMMGPQGASLIQHHYAEMMKLVNRLKE